LVQAEQQAVPGLVIAIFGLIGQVAEGGGEPLGMLRGQPEVPQHHERLRFGGGDVRSNRAERDLGEPAGVLDLQLAEGTPVVLLSAAPHVPRSGQLDQASVGEHLEVMCHVALVAVQHRGELADRRLALAQGEQQPMPHGVAQGLELLRLADGNDVFLHSR